MLSYIIGKAKSNMRLNWQVMYFYQMFVIYWQNTAHTFNQIYF